MLAHLALIIALGSDDPYFNMRVQSELRRIRMAVTQIAYGQNQGPVKAPERKLSPFFQRMALGMKQRQDLIRRAAKAASMPKEAKVVVPNGSEG